MVADELKDSRVNVAGPCSHDNALKRSKTHGCVHALSADGGRYRSAVSKVAYDNFCVFLEVSELDGLAAYEHMACSVESVAAYLVFLVVLVRNCIEVSFLFHTHSE